MKRETLFKAKRPDGQGWVAGYLTPYNHAGYIGKDDRMVIHYGIVDSVEVIPETVCQFTGLTDKNGAKIFEGDRLYISAGYCPVVEFEDGCFVSIYSHPEDGETIPLFEVIGKETEIIGNIHD